MINFSELLWTPSSRSQPRSPALKISSLGASALAKVPVVKTVIHPGVRIVVATDLSSPGADRFRFLRMRLRELRSASAIQSILVTSALPKEGKSTVAMNLATVLADGGKSSVLLVEGDLHRPSIASGLGIPAARGLAECLEIGIDPISVIQRVEPLGFYLLHAGATKGNPTQVLQDEGLGATLDGVRQHFDWIVIDTPPLAVLTDALLLGRCADTSLMVIRADVTPRAAVDEALARLGAEHVFGILVNGEAELNDAASKYAAYYQRR
ncbi:MAG: CpsD/CapB family tyrosine-protein kinase [Bryobacteraceae bacterium]